MDRSELIVRRRKKYLGQLLEVFERDIQPRIPEDVAQRFKAKVRHKMKALSDDAVEIVELDHKTELNGHAIHQRDTLEADARLGRGDHT